MINHTVFRGPLLGTEESGKYATKVLYKVVMGLDSSVSQTFSHHKIENDIHKVLWRDGWGNLPTALQAQGTSIFGTPLKKRAVDNTYKILQIFYKIFFKSNLLR